MDESTATETAVKPDDAEVPVRPWDKRVLYLLGENQMCTWHHRAFKLLREAMWRRWKKCVISSWLIWWWSKQSKLAAYGENIVEVIRSWGSQACRYARRSSFWAWEGRSGVFLWRWPEEYFWDVALGLPPNWIGTPEPRITEQRNLGEPDMIHQIAAKIADMQRKGYIAPGECAATMNFFAVPKGTSDIRMVYDGTKSGLNNCLYVPWFPLPDAEVLINTLDDELWCIDNDYREMFLNFWLHPELARYSGMDFTALVGRERKSKKLHVEV
ncbi:hypothetical protein ACA910_018150 [Epithemia clementina (nom. ined.)]